MIRGIILTILFMLMPLIVLLIISFSRELYFNIIYLWVIGYVLYLSIKFFMSPKNNFFIVLEFPFFPKKICQRTFFCRYVTKEITEAREKSRFEVAKMFRSELVKLLDLLDSKKIYITETNEIVYGFMKKRKEITITYVKKMKVKKQTAEFKKFQRSPNKNEKHQMYVVYFCKNTELK